MAEKYIYKHVAIVGLDGMGNFNKHTATPNMDRIFENGAQSFDSLSLYPTISAQNWGAMLLGTMPEVHGLTNSIVSRDLYTNKEIPSIFTTVRKSMPDSVLCSVSQWEPINHGIIEHDVDVFMQTADNGVETTDKVVDCVLSQKPTLLFVQNDEPDGAGHGNGYGTKGHLDRITETDVQVNRIYEAYEKAGIIDDTLFIVIADHGGYKTGHGGYTDGEKYIYFALAGKTVNNVSFFAQTKDINAIVRHAFGIEIPEYNIEGYSSQVPAGVFSDCDTVYKTEPKAQRFEMQKRPTPAINGKDGLLSIFDEKDIKFAMFFDNESKDELGKVKFTEENHVKYYSLGVNGAMAEFGSTGYLVSDEVKFGADSFSVAQWLKVDDAPCEDCYICGTKSMSTPGAGFSLAFTNVGTRFGIETPERDTYFSETTTYFNNVSGGWIHAIYCFDKKAMKIDVYHNFVFKKSYKLADKYDRTVDELPFTIGEDASHKCNQENKLIFNMDDMFVFNKALNAEDVEKLKKYYGL